MEVHHESTLVKLTVYVEAEKKFLNRYSNQDDSLCLLFENLEGFEL